MTTIAQLTDLHWFSRPPITSVINKRLIGTANLYLRHRRHHFSNAIADQAVAAVVSLAPDALVVTGDLTAQALPREFDLAYNGLKPAFDAMPVLVQRGNHDVYTRGAARHDRIRERFSPWLHRHSDGIARLTVRDVSILGLDPNRPHFFASGLMPQTQLDALSDALTSVPSHHAILLAQHYPVVDRHDVLDNGLDHGLRNAEALVAAFRASPRRPNLLIHGHVHHGYRAKINLDAQTHIPSANPGSSGYAWLPHQNRAACFCLHHFEDGAYTHSDRYRYDGSTFTPEPGGAWASGR